MSDRKRVWVSPDGEGGWNIKTQGKMLAIIKKGPKIIMVGPIKTESGVFTG